MQRFFHFFFSRGVGGEGGTQAGQTNTQQDFVSDEKLHIKSSSPPKVFDVQTTEALLIWKCSFSYSIQVNSSCLITDANN